ncbi:hypothetical protein [Crossiella cryophila]|uniref:Uncharacterized protein n=1 Tax=Crossiella cryophila TaxID=43355 RepID=A0A7W7CIU0_9PSEU|nr:hypothetical protein [Crossiella cryophila]MBB4680566.1 hypothetical protein [Crossiella cryophila]
MQRIERPLAQALVRWLTAAEGGRQSGPPTATVYRSTASFQSERDPLDQPRPPTEAHTVLLQETECLPDGRRRCLVGFLAPDLMRPHLRAGARLLVLEGPRTVATADIEVVLD